MERSRIQSGFTILLLLVILGLAFLAQGLHEDPDAHPHSVSSTGDEGRRGFFLLLQELGFSPREWRGTPGELPRGEHLLWMPEEPVAWSPDRGGEALAPGEAARLPSHALEHYRAFVDQGGTLIAPITEGVRDFLTEDFGLPEAQQLEFRDAGERETRSVRLESGEKLELALDLASLLRPFPAGSPWRELWLLEKQEGEVGSEFLAAVELPCGNGRVVLLSEDVFLDNSEIGKQQHALAGVRLIEELSRGGELYFDEYCLGLWEPTSALALSASPRVFLLTAHALLLLALFVWARSWARSFPRDPPPRAAVSPLERAEALARIWERGGRTQLAARALRKAAAVKPVRKTAATELEALAREIEAPSRARG